MDPASKGVKRAAMDDAEADPVSTITRDILRQIEPHQSKIRRLWEEMEEEHIIVRNLEATAKAAGVHLKEPANSNHGALPMTGKLRIGAASDVPTPADSKPNIARNHYVMPELSSLHEELLFKWQMGLELQGMHVSRKALQDTATDIWNRVPEARNEASVMPKFDEDWAALFQQRRLPGVRRATDMHTNHFTVHEQMLAVRERAQTLPRGNLYTMSVTRLYWRRTPCPTLTEVKPSGVSQNQYISIALTTNDLGEKEFPVWAVGQVHDPVALHKFNHETLRVKWKANSRGCVTIDVMMDWLVDFYEYIRAAKPGEHVLLLLDDVDAARIAVGLREPPGNIVIAYYPGYDNADQYRSPMNSGIIAAFKMHYRKLQLVWFICDTNEYTIKKGADPVRDMDLRRALTWIWEAWFFYSDPAIDETSFLAAQVRMRTGFSNNIPIEENTRELYAEALPWEAEKMRLEDFLFGPDENSAVKAPRNMSAMLTTVIQDWSSYVGNAKDCQSDADEEYFSPPQAVSAMEARNHVQALMSMVEARDLMVQPDEFLWLRGLKETLEDKLDTDEFLFSRGSKEFREDIMDSD